MKGAGAVGLNEKQFKLILFASIAIDLVAVAIIIFFVHPLLGLLAAAFLALGEYFVYRWVFLPMMAERESLSPTGSEDAPDTR
jgi:hypothetical protein